MFRGDVKSVEIYSCIIMQKLKSREAEQLTIATSNLADEMNQTFS